MSVASARLRSFNHVFPKVERVVPTPQASPSLGVTSSPIEKQGVNDVASILFSESQDTFRVIIEWLNINIKNDIDTSRLEEALNRTDALSIIGVHKEEIRAHVENHLQPQLSNTWSEPTKLSEAPHKLELTSRLLQAHLEDVLEPFSNIVSESEARKVAQVREAAHRTFQSFAFDHLGNHSTITRSICRVIRSVVSAFLKSGQLSESDKTNLFNLRWLCHAGGLMPTCHALLASTIQSQICEYVNHGDMRVDWIGRQEKTGVLLSWVRTALYPIISVCLRAMKDEHPVELTSWLGIAEHSGEPNGDSEVVTYQKMALNVLGRARSSNILDYVQRWPASTGAIEELKRYSDESRQNKDAIRTTLIAQMDARLLHAGVTTAELLGIYVNLIHVCLAFSPQGLLLEQVAAPLRTLLRDRSNTVKVIAASFLAELDENGNLVGTMPSSDGVATSITREILRTESLSLAPKPPLDWSDMAWEPDPIGAGPDHRLDRHNDVVHYMMSLFERDAFVKEIEGILGERLLRSEDENLAIESRLVDMLKSRLGDDRLQAAEVMLRDMRDSARIGMLISSIRSRLPRVEDVWANIPDAGIAFSDLMHKMRLQLPGNPLMRARFAEIFKVAANVKVMDSKSVLVRNPSFNPSGTAHEDTTGRYQLVAKVVSSFFWPKLRDDQFKLPGTIRREMQEFEREFVTVKKQRKLEWMPALGRATVELELSDRTVLFENVKTWVAAVIHAFQPIIEEQAMDIDEGSQGVRKSVSQLEEELNMDELLVRNALSYWTTQRVLIEVEPDTFEVLEVLPKEGEEPTKTSASRGEDTVSALKSKTAVLEENKQLYEMFITGMLTNGGAMEPMRIAMMLNMAMPNGFEYGDEGVLWILQGMEAEGKVQKQGEAWTIKK